MARVTRKHALPVDITCSLGPGINAVNCCGRSIGRRKVNSIAVQVMKHDAISKEIIKQVGKAMAKELKSVCALNPMSILRNRGPEALKSFLWSTLVEELKKRAPSTVSLLEACCKRQYRYGTPKWLISNRNMLVSIVCSVMLRMRSQRMNLIQRMVSVILYAGHASKQVLYIVL